jgi:peptide chain release factor 1
LAEKRDVTYLLWQILRSNEIIADNSDADMTEMAKMQQEAKEDYQN